MLKHAALPSISVPRLLAPYCPIFAFLIQQGRRGRCDPRTEKMFPVLSFQSPEHESFIGRSGDWAGGAESCTWGRAFQRNRWRWEWGGALAGAKAALDRPRSTAEICTPKYLCYVCIQTHQLPSTPFCPSACHPLRKRTQGSVPFYVPFSTPVRLSEEAENQQNHKTHK